MENQIAPEHQTAAPDAADIEPPVRRALRSYVIRGGRQTVAQQVAIEKHWSTYVIADHQSVLDTKAQFGRSAPLVLEIGFGMGDSLAEMALNNPDKDYIGIEVHRAGVGKLINYIENGNIRNLRIFCHDAVEILANCIADHSLDLVQIFFPDPWHKKKHQKRRLIQTPFMLDLIRKLKPGDIFIWPPTGSTMPSRCWMCSATSIPFEIRLAAVSTHRIPDAPKPSLSAAETVSDTGSGT